MVANEDSFDYKGFCRRWKRAFLKELKSMESQQGPTSDGLPASEPVDQNEEQWREALLKECRFYSELRLVNDPNDVVDMWLRPTPQEGPCTADLIGHFDGDRTAMPDAAASQLGLQVGATYADAVKEICAISEWASTTEFCLREQATAEYRERRSLDGQRGACNDGDCTDWRNEGF